MQGVVAHVPGAPNAVQKLTHSAWWDAQLGVGPVQSMVAGLAHGVCPSPQVHDMRTPAAPQAGNVVVVVEVVVVVVVDVEVSQTVPAPHTPEQQSKFPRQPWSPS